MDITANLSRRYPFHNFWDLEVTSILIIRLITGSRLAISIFCYLSRLFNLSRHIRSWRYHPAWCISLSDFVSLVMSCFSAIKFTFFQNRLKQDWEDTITNLVGESASRPSYREGRLPSFLWRLLTLRVKCAIY